MINNYNEVIKLCKELRSYDHNWDMVGANKPNDEAIDFIEFIH